MKLDRILHILAWGQQQDTLNCNTKGYFIWLWTVNRLACKLHIHIIYSYICKINIYMCILYYKRWNWSSCTKLVLSVSWTHGLITQSVRPSERNSVVMESVSGEYHTIINIYIYIYIYNDIISIYKNRGWRSTHIAQIPTNQMSIIYMHHLNITY